jgi:hypothetical protein
MSLDLSVAQAMQEQINELNTYCDGLLHRCERLAERIDGLEKRLQAEPALRIQYVEEPT